MIGRSLILPLALVAATAASITIPQVAFSQTFGYEEESPQRFALEFRFGPYRPDVDQGVQGNPFETTFGSGSEFYFEGQLDWQAFRFYIGTFAVGGSLGIMHASANAFVQSDDGSSTDRSEDETGLWMMPVTLLITLRFDYLNFMWGVPFVPYFKFGFTYALWWATGEDGVSSNDGDRAVGGTAGLRIGGGLMLCLDWLEPRAARTFDNEVGVNNSYLFFEYYWAYLDGFGNNDRMNLSDATWAAGLAFEF